MAENTTGELTAFVERMGGAGTLRIEENLGDGFVRLRVAEAERRQAKHDIRCVEDVVIELLRNARDAGARHILVATAREGELRTIVTLDDGSGIPEHVRERVFDARVTSKLESVHVDRWGVHGRGMALFAVRENTLRADVTATVVGGGCAMLVQADTTALPERSDQSTWPTLDVGDDGEPALGRGPHNIVRSCCEFALVEQGRCDVYVGSMADVVATARACAHHGQPSGARALSARLESLGVLERFAVASDARELAQAAADCGLDISERTAHRILGGEVAPLPSIMRRLRRPARARHRGVDLSAEHRGLRLSDEDRQELCKRMERDFMAVAERYYLKLVEAPSLRVGGDRLTVTFRFENED